MPVSRDNVVGLFWNLLRRAPGEADIAAHTKAESVQVLGKAFIESGEFLSSMVKETFRWWLKREPTGTELVEWVNNFRRLGQIEGMKHIICSKESLRYCVDPLQDGSAIVPSDKFWSGTVFANQLIRWWKQREPHEPKEGLRYALQVNVGGEFAGFQIWNMLVQEPDSIDIRVRRNYTELLGRDITPAEYVHWRAAVANAVWVHQIASSPEGLAHGLSLSRQRSVEPVVVSHVPPAPLEQLPLVTPPDCFAYPEG